MKSLIMIIFICFSFSCISGGGRSLKPQLDRERKDQDKLWRPCQDFEVKNTETRNPVGKLCNRTKGKSKIKNFCKKEDFLFFRSGSFIVIDEDNL